jgi:hypothetical protein
MVRAWSIVLGVGLVVLGIAELNTPSSSWIGWLDIVGGILSFGVAATVSGVAPVSTALDVRPRSTNAGSLLFICAGLFVMWIVGLVSGNVTTGMAWWNFAFACAYGLLAISSYGGRGMMRKVPTADLEHREGPRRAA